jgi:hypothetical protein
MRPSFLLPMLAVLATSAFGAAGCKRMAERMEEKGIEKSTGGQVHINGENGTISVTNDSGTGTVSVGTGAKLPDDFPATIPIYPGAKPSLAAKTADPRGKAAWSLALETADAKDQVVAFYKAKMSGFTVESSMDMGTTSMNVYKSAQYEVTVMVATESGSKKTVITINAVTK